MGSNSFYLVVESNVEEYYGSVFNLSALEAGLKIGSWPMGMIVASMKEKGVFYRVIKGKDNLQELERISAKGVSQRAIGYFNRTMEGIKRDRLIRRRRDGTVVEKM